MTRKKETFIIIILCALIFVGAFCLLLIKNEDKKEPVSVDETPKAVEEAKVEEISKKKDYISLKDLDYTKLDDSNWIIKYEDDKYISSIGIDVSEFNKSTDFYTLKSEGIDFVFIRVGWRGYTEGNIYRDKYFEDYYREAKDAGLKIGFYFFSQATSEEEAKEEADFVLNQLKDKECDMYVCFDMESPGGSEGRIANKTKEERTSYALTFSKIIEENGYKPMIYANKDWSINYYDMNKLKDIPIWYALYDDYPEVDFDFALWQYTASASVYGSSLVNRTDLNLMLIEK